MDEGRTKVARTHLAGEMSTGRIDWENPARLGLTRVAVRINKNTVVPISPEEVTMVNNFIALPCARLSLFDYHYFVLGIFTPTRGGGSSIVAPSSRRRLRICKQFHTSLR